MSHGSHFFKCPTFIYIISKQIFAHFYNSLPQKVMFTYSIEKKYVSSLVQIVPYLRVKKSRDDLIKY